MEGVQVQTDFNALKVKHETDLKEQEIIRLSQENTIARLQMSIYGGLSLFVIGFLVFEIRRRKQKAKQTAQVQALKLANTEQELEYKKQDITRKALEIGKKQDFAKQLLEQLNGFEQHVETDAHKEWRNFEHRVRNHLQTNEEQQVFQENIEKINQAFYAKLGGAYPSLSTSEKDLCSYIRLGLSNKEISVLRGVTPGASDTGGADAVA